MRKKDELIAPESCLLRYLSLFSGIEAASVAWNPLGWRAVGFAEIDPFACALLAHHYPEVPNHGDVATLEVPPESADVVVGGSPCQSFSVAGRRLGLDDPRGNMALHFLRVARGSRASWMVFENVPGLLSSTGGADFAAFLSAATGWDVPVPLDGWRNTGIGPGRTADDYSVCWRILDAQHFGVPQRRRRVFVVGHLGDWRRVAAVLLERGCMSGDPAPRREAKSIVTQSLTGGPNSTSAGNPDDNRAQGGFLVANSLTGSMGRRNGQPGKWGEVTSNLIAGTLGGGSGNRGWCNDLDRAGAFVAGSQTARYGKGTDSDACDPMIVTHSLRADGFDASEDGTGRGTPIVPVALQNATRVSDQNGIGIVDPDAPMFTLDLGSTHAIAFQEMGRADGRTLEWREDQSYALRAIDGGGCGDWFRLANTSGVRRLTPKECERLQGFPDNYTLVKYRGKPATDGSRYRAIGNSMAVPVMAWIGERIQRVHDLIAEAERQ